MKNEFLENGFAIAENIFTNKKIDQILQVIENKTIRSKNYRINQELFAVRSFLGEIPELQSLVLVPKIQELLSKFGKNYQVVKSIYFDKPPKANWVVNWHQDLTISVKSKTQMAGFMSWLPKKDYFSVQPPESYLQNIITLRIHLDDCTKLNGALRVIPKSHQKIQDIKTLESDFFENDTICEVEKGGVLLMKPLIWHSSK